MPSDFTDALLSMDAYNRGANAGLTVNFTKLGDYSEYADASWGFFQAAAYRGTGGTIIAYRGTDELPKITPTPTLGDMTAWLGGVGFHGQLTQFAAAEEFYNQIARAATNVTVTGHSLGGGLAGYIAALNGIGATVFNWMPFEFAAEARYYDLNGLSSPLSRLGQYSQIYTDYVAGEALSYVRPLAQSAGPAVLATQYLPPISLLLTANALAGKAAENNLGPIDPGKNDLSPVQLHSSALLVLLRWAEDGQRTLWKGAGSAILSELYSDQIAEKAGISDSTFPGHWSSSDKMRAMIAYSAVTDGTGFGNTAIKALFHDADVLGDLVQIPDVASYLKDDKVQKGIADIIDQYAGLLAANKDTKTNNASGVLTYNSARNRLTVDFSRNRWTLPDGSNADIVGKKSLTDAALQFGGGDPSSIQKAVDTLWNGKTDNIVKLVAVTTDAAGITLDAVVDGGIGGADTPATDGAMLVMGGGGGTLSGSKGNNLLVGGAGDDTLIAGNGDDLMFGGAGKDTFKMYDDTGLGRPTSFSGNHWLDGGAGWDTADYSKLTDPLTATVDRSNGVVNKDPIITITNSNSNGSTDYLVSVENIKLGTGANTVKVNSLPATPFTDPVIDLGATSLDSGDTVDFSQYGGNVYLKSAGGLPDGTHAVELFRDKGFTQPTGLSFNYFNTLILGDGDNLVNIPQADDLALSKIEMGNGALEGLTTDAVDVTINLGSGTDVVVHAGRGDVINVNDGGKALIGLSADILVSGAKPTDVILTKGGRVLHGAVGHIVSNSAWMSAPAASNTPSTVWASSRSRTRTSPPPTAPLSPTTTAAPACRSVSRPSASSSRAGTSNRSGCST
jgi:serralysin